ncbi:MAG: ribonuclease P protein component [Lentisphaerae bacterium]|nr:ribonuclease P protein component [Lentisphaerota bacterium]
MGASASCGNPEAGPGAGSRPASRGQTLTRRQRITDKAVFQEAFDQSTAYAGRFLVMRLRRGPGASLRLGVVVSKRALRRSVDRSRAKRLLREAFRLNRALLNPSCDVVLIARQYIHGATRQEVEQDLLKVARKAGLMESPARGKAHAQGAAD